MNNSNILFSLKKPFNGNQKDWPRFKREFNAIVNASKASKLLRKRDALISTSKSDDLDLSLDDNVKMQNLYDLNTQLFSYLQLNVTSPKDIMLIDKCMNKVNVEGNLFDAWNILIDKYEPKNSVTKNKLISSFDNIKQELSDTCVEYLNKVLAIKNDLELNFNYIIDDTLFVTKVINNLILKDVDDAKFKLKLQSMNLDVSGLEKELINHDSYLESLKDIISNLDSTIINNSSSALSTSSINVGNNFKKKKKKNNKSKSSNINHHKNNTRYVNNSQHFNNDDKNNKQLLCTKCGNKGHETKFCWSDILCRYCNKKVHT